MELVSIFVSKLFFNLCKSSVISGRFRIIPDCLHSELKLGALCFAPGEHKVNSPSSGASTVM